MLCLAIDAAFNSASQSRLLLVRSRVGAYVEVLRQCRMLSGMMPQDEPTDRKEWPPLGSTGALLAEVVLQRLPAAAALPDMSDSSISGGAAASSPAPTNWLSSCIQSSSVRKTN